MVVDERHQDARRSHNRIAMLFMLVPFNPDYAPVYDAMKGYAPEQVGGINAADAFCLQHSLLCSRFLTCAKS